MAIEFVQGDLLSADVEALVNTVNCVGVMGKGLALQFKRQFPGVFKEYAAACRKGEVQIGQMLAVPTGLLSNPMWVINFPTKKHWRSPSKLEWIQEGLKSLVQVVRDYDIESIAIPPLGVGNGGLSWVLVKPLIEDAMGELEDVRVFIYSPSSNVHEIRPSERLRMTRTRALTIALLQRYVAERQEVEPWEDLHGASHLEIQKLMYFADIMEPRLNLRFAPGRYGPYSDRVRHILQEMEGTYTRGLGDGSGKVLDLDPIAPTERGIDETVAFVDADQGGAIPSVVDSVMEIVEGFEGPYGVELLASTDWVRRFHEVNNVSEIAEKLREWTERKGRLFTEHHVDSALRQLDASVA